MADPRKIYTCRKGPLLSVLKDPDKYQVLARIKDAVIRMNRMTIHVYHFIEAYCLYRHQNGQPLPLITEWLIRDIFSLLSISDHDMSNISEELLFFNNVYFRPLMLDEPISRANLYQVITYATTTILTAIENNIKVHFIKRLFGFINSVFTHAYIQQHGEPQTRRGWKDLRKHIRSFTKIIKDHLTKGTPIHPDHSAYPWVQLNRPYLIPSQIEQNIFYDLKVSPQKYLPSMIFMNLELERIERKQFQCFPLRSEVVPKQIDLDTAALLALLPIPDKGAKQRGQGAIKRNKKELWNDLFDLKNPIFNKGPKRIKIPKKPNEPKSPKIPRDPKGYRFDYAIKTDGIGVSVRLVRNDKYGKRYIKPKVDPDLIEFPYFEDLTPKQLQDLRQAHKVYIDPGKNNLIYCVDDNDKTFRYTRGQRIKETQRFKNQATIKRFKDQHHLELIEARLSQVNSKTCDFGRFLAYVQVKNQVNQELFPHYEREFLRKIRLRGYINTQRSEGKLIRNIKDIYGTDANGVPHNKRIALIYGDWNIGRHLRGIVSTPVIGLKRRLAKAFWVVNIDEHRTSKLDWRSSQENWKAKVKMRVRDETTGQMVTRMKRSRDVLVSNKYINGKMSNDLIFQNRDRNAVFNMRKLTRNYLFWGVRLPAYCRGDPPPLTLQMMVPDPGAGPRNHHPLVLNVIGEI